MSRNRQRNRHFPRGLHLKGKRFYYVTSGTPRRWICLHTDIYATALVELAKIVGRPNRVTTVKELLAMYIEHRTPEIADVTAVNYGCFSRKLCSVFGEMNVDDVRPGHVARYLDQHPRKSSANNEVGLLSSAFKLAQRWELVERNPCDAVAKHKLKPRDRYLDDEALIAIRAKAEPWFQLAIDLAYMTGLRPGDVRRMRWVDVEGDVIDIVQHKTKKPIKFTLTTELRALLGSIRALHPVGHSPYLFPSPQTRLPYTAPGFSTVFRKAASAAGVADATMHDIRAKNASDEQAGARDRLGHSNEALTRRVYIRKVNPVAPIAQIAKNSRRGAP